MTKPLALLCYEKLLPGSQLVNRLQDLGYRVQTVHRAAELAATAAEAGPLVVIVDLSARQGDPCAAIAALRKDRATSHLPVIAFAGERHQKLQAAARTAGATLVATESGLLLHLEPLLDQALHVD